MPPAFHQSPFFPFVRHANGLLMLMMNFRVYIFFFSFSGIILYSLFLGGFARRDLPVSCIVHICFPLPCHPLPFLNLFSEKFQENSQVFPVKCVFLIFTGKDLEFGSFLGKPDPGETLGFDKGG